MNGNGFRTNLPGLREISLMNCLQKDMAKVIKPNSHTIVHAHSPLLCGYPAYNIAKKLKIPVVYEVRALWEDAAVDLGKTNKVRYFLTRYLETDLLKKVDGIITICEGLKKEIVGRGINEKKVYVVPNGVDTVAFMPQEKDKNLIKKLGLEGKTTIGFIGSFYRYEGLKYIVEAMPKILAQFPNTVAILVGKGEQENILKQLVVQSSLMDKIIFTGQMPHNEILNYYSLIDILVYPREKNRLTDMVTPLKVLEAMAMQKGVIGSDVGGIKELIQNEKTGLIFKAGDSNDLADKCIELINNPQKYQALGQNAREYVLSERNWEIIIKKHLDIYTELLENNNAKSN
jgi:PEP-CTERM/exosortase A-associated glycosyltransferase